MGNKQEELETCTCLHGCDITGITQKLWWGIRMEGCWLFMKDWLGDVSLEEYGEIVQEAKG